MHIRVDGSFDRYIGHDYFTPSPSLSLPLYSCLVLLSSRTLEVTAKNLFCYQLQIPSWVVFIILILLSFFVFYVYGQESIISWFGTIAHSFLYILFWPVGFIFFNEALFDFCRLISFVSFSPFYLSLFHFRFYFLLGSGCSGKTTFLKQLRILYGDGYTEKERKEFKPVIYGNVRRAMIRILEAMEEIGLTFANEELSTKVIQCCGR